MKLLILTVLSIVVFAACQKPQPLASPTPELKVIFGYQELFSFEAFWNQDSISRDSLDMTPYLGLQLEEKNLPKSAYDAGNNPTFVFDAFTHGDKEHYDTRQNATFHLDQKFMNSEVNIKASGFIPIKLGIKPKPGNDTLEFSPTGDCIRIDYASQYANAKTRDSLYVKP